MKIRQGGKEKTGKIWEGSKTRRLRGVGRREGVRATKPRKLTNGPDRREKEG